MRTRCPLAFLFLLCSFVVVACLGNAPEVGRGGDLSNFKDLYEAASVFEAEGRNIDALIKEGKELATSMNTEYGYPACGSCHQLPGGGSSMTGPSLIDVAKRYTEHFNSEKKARVWLYNKIHEPDAFIGQKTRYYGSGIMPPMKDYHELKGKRIEAIVEYLMSIDKEK